MPARVPARGTGPPRSLWSGDNGCILREDSRDCSSESARQQVMPRARDRHGKVRRTLSEGASGRVGIPGIGPQTKARSKGKTLGISNQAGRRAYACATTTTSLPDPEEDWGL